MALTDLQVKNLSPQNRRYELSDGDGLYLRVDPTGTKSWVYRYVFEGRRRRMSLGVYPGISLSSARGKHREAEADIQKGIDPGEKARAAKEKRKAEPTFSELLDEFWDVELQHKSAGKATKRLIEKDTAAWKHRKVSDIKRRDIVLLLDKIRGRAPVTANRVHGALSRLFNFAAERGVIDDSPCVRIRKTPEKGRDRVLTDDEIKVLWRALDLENKDVDIYRVTKLALKMILLTGQRPGEVCGMRWDEVDGDVWMLPPERTKNSEPQQVPLTGMALEVIEQARMYSGDCDFVFRSSYKPKEALSRPALARAIKRHFKEMGIDNAFTPHDLRRTLRTRLAELGISDIVAERVLGHKLRGMMAVYNRHAYEAEKRQALDRWEGRLKQILGIETEAKAEVIPLGVKSV